MYYVRASTQMYFIDELQCRGVRYLPKVITNEYTAKERYSTPYMLIMMFCVCMCRCLCICVVFVGVMYISV